VTAVEPTGPGGPGVPLFRVLGPIELWVDGVQVDIRPGKQMTAFAALVASWGRPISQDRMIDLLWDEPPRAVDSSLKSVVSRLKASLHRAHPDLDIHRLAGGWVLVTGNAVVDRDEFERVASTAQRAFVAGDHQRTVLAADAGLALWRGPAFGDLADLPLLLPHALGLDERRSALVLLRGEALLALGRTDQLVADVREALGHSPLSERLVHLLMTGLARAGRHPEALEAFEAFRRRLVEHGLRPTDELRDLDHRIAQHDPLLVAGPRPALGLWRLPPELTIASPVSVGRDHERRMLREALASVADEGRAFVVVRGEAGAGKSHLAAAVAREAHDGGALVLAGACEDEVRAPLAPFVRALRFFRTQTGDEGDELLAPWWSELTRLLPEVPNAGAGPPVGYDPQTERSLLFDAVAGWLASASAMAPVVLVLEDLHWADETTLLLLKHLSGAGGLSRLLVLATVRDPEPATPGLLEEVVAAARRDGVLFADLSLTGLSTGELADLVGEVRADLIVQRDELARVVHERTKGNPLFASELLSELPTLSPGDDTAPAELVDRLGAPPSAVDLASRRLRQLDDHGRRVLTDAALIGGEVGFDLLMEVVGLAPDDLLQALDLPIDLGLLVHLPDAGGRLRFDHAVFRDALVARLRPVERIDGHRRIAAAILRLEPHRRQALVEDLALHASEAALVDGPAAAIPHALAAGDQALDRRAFAHAAHWFGRALDLADAAGVPPGPAPRVADDDGGGADDAWWTRFDILCALGGAQRQAGEPGFRDAILTAAQLARDADDGDGIAEAALLGTRGFFRQTAVPDHEWIDLLQGAVDSTTSSGSAHALLLASLASELVWADPDERRFELSDAAVALARAGGSDPLLSQVLLFRMVTVWAPDTAEERRAVAAEMLELTERTGDLALRCHALRFGSAAAIELGRRDEAEVWFEECRRLTDEVARPDLAWHLLLAGAGWSLLAGDLTAAHHEARAALQAGDRAGQPEAMTFHGAIDLELRRLRGTNAPVIDALAAHVEDIPPDPANGFLRHVAAGGRHDVARPMLAAAVAALPDLGRGVHTLPALANLADVAVRLGDREAAEAVLPRLRPHADQFTQAIIIQPVGHHFLGRLELLLGRRDEAEAHLAAALDAHRAVRAPIHEAETLLAWSALRPEHAAAGRCLAETHHAPGLLQEPGG
jgi:DNA-binding SARP family transcriptional activator